MEARSITRCKIFVVDGKSGKPCAEETKEWLPKGASDAVFHGFTFSRSVFGLIQAETLVVNEQCHKRTDAKFIQANIIAHELPSQMQHPRGGIASQLFLGCVHGQKLCHGFGLRMTGAFS